MHRRIVPRRELDRMGYRGEGIKRPEIAGVLKLSLPVTQSCRNFGDWVASVVFFYF